MYVQTTRSEAGAGKVGGAKRRVRGDVVNEVMGAAMWS